MDAIRNNTKRFLSIKETDNLYLKIAKLNCKLDVHKDDRPKNKEAMLQVMQSFEMSESLKDCYQYAFKRRKEQLQAMPNTQCLEIESSTKVLLGLGNASVHEFGTSLSYPYGVPYIPGSSIKGLISSYLEKKGGRDWWRSSADLQKSRLQVELFGGDLEENNKLYSYIGNVIFNDAWLVVDERRSKDTWFVNDIITPHHQDYYSRKKFPDGMNNPIPIKISALKPGLKFLLSLQASENALQFLLPVIEEAFEIQGIGGKTSIGYGRFKFVDSVEDLANEKNERLNAAKRKALSEERQATMLIDDKFRNNEDVTPGGALVTELKALIDKALGWDSDEDKASLLTLAKEIYNKAYPQGYRKNKKIKLRLNLLKDAISGD